MTRWSLLGGFVVSVALLAVPATSLGRDLSLDPIDAPAPIAQRWARADGSQARGGTSQDWLWGPALRAIAREPYREAPGGSREVFYFDKSRMEITHPDGDQRALWYVSNGLLVRELISGQIQIGDDAFIQSDPAAIPLTGDIQGNPSSPTYATLAPLASIGPDLDARRARPRVGREVTALLRADGTIDAGAARGSGVTIAAYDTTFGHNIPALFTGWAERQPFPWEYTVGHPLTEPYWVDTVVAGKPKRVLVQAFERRVLTYTPDNPDGWKVEAGNVGIHYRLWRGLRVPDDPKLVPLARGVPLGEVIVDKAIAHGLNPYLFAALAQTASHFDPRGSLGNGGVGLFGLRPELAKQAPGGHALDPAVNADLAATEIARLHAQFPDWRAVLADYYVGSTAPDWSDPALNAFVTGVLDTWAAMITRFTPPPPPPPPPPAPSLKLWGVGAAAYYSPGYTVSWWESTLRRHASWGNAVPGWKLDPNGYYCVNPDFRPGQRLQLRANGVTLWCTIGDAVAAGDQAAWRAKWVVELSYNTFLALHLERYNRVEVRYP